MKIDLECDLCRLIHNCLDESKKPKYDLTVLLDKFLSKWSEKLPKHVNYDEHNSKDIESLISALEFYSNKNNYDEDGVVIDAILDCKSDFEFFADRGHRARCALNMQGDDND